ncbi:uncharacterized protein [Diabrotica undecimpunctata]|uniref:uncharacterized protein n=1 Tax=Diabrotica undecimpunctata TaxID=50387 RepID=UPI003B639FED
MPPKIATGVAAATVSENVVSATRLTDGCSVYTAELQAILDALNHCKTTHEKQILILSDSLSSLQAIKHVYPTHINLFLIKDALQQLQFSGKTISFMWVPSHVGITSNELEDKTAFEAIKNVNIPTTTGILISDSKTLFKNHVNKIWQEI